MPAWNAAVQVGRTATETVDASPRIARMDLLFRQRASDANSLSGFLSLFQSSNKASSLPSPKAVGPWHLVHWALPPLNNSAPARIEACSFSGVSVVARSGGLINFFVGGLPFGRHWQENSPPARRAFQPALLSRFRTKARCSRRPALAIASSVWPRILRYLTYSTKASTSSLRSRANDGIAVPMIPSRMIRVRSASVGLSPRSVALNLYRPGR